MTTTRWLIAAFWAVMLGIAFWYAFQSIMAPPPPVVPEKHWFPPPLPATTAAPSADADVRLAHYVMKQMPNSSTFTADVIVQNFGRKKATGIQVKIQPYVGTTDTNPAAPGADEIPSQPGGDPMANVTQWVTFPDLGPGETATQTLTFSERGDADPAQAQPHSQVIFQTVP